MDRKLIILSAGLLSVTALLGGYIAYNSTNTRTGIPEFEIFDLRITYYKGKYDIHVSQITFSIHNIGNADAHNVQVTCYRLNSWNFRSKAIDNSSMGDPLKIGTIQKNGIESIVFNTFPKPFCNWSFDDGVFSTDHIEVKIRIEVRCDQIDPKSFTFSSTIRVS